MAPRITLLGKRFGRLVAIERVPRKGKGGRVGYICRCDCGTEKYVQDSNLVSGSTTSCGCFQKEYLSGRYDKIETRLSEIIRYYKRNDRAVGRRFELTREEVRSIVSRPCNYCGYVGEPLNGIDRINNVLGHVFSNSTPCCETCNRAKMAMSLQDFLSWSKRLAIYQGWCQ